MKRVLLILLILFPVYLSVSLYYLDKEYFLCPIKYERDILVRCDSMGNGYFAANRSGRRLHRGVDLFASIGTPVFASRSGRASSATQNNGMGKYVVLEHPGGIKTIYGHLSDILVAKNGFVRQGQIIGLVGKTGNSNHPCIQPHLHLEVRKDDVAEDPMGYLE